MAHTKQAAKRHRQNLKARARNKAMSTEMKGAIKRLLAGADAKSVSDSLPKAMKTIDKAAKHHVIHKNTAARYKARVSRALNRAKAAAKSAAAGAMGGSFQTDERHSDAALRPLRVALRREGVWEEAKNLAGELPGWKILSADEHSFQLVCERAAGLLGGTARVTITVDGPAGLPSATVSARSESQGGLLSRDKSIVLEFMKPFWRRVC